MPATLLKAVPNGLNGRDLLGGGALLALHEVKLNLLALGERAEALGLNGCVMDENVAAVGLNETEALGVVKPLDRSGLAICHDTYLSSTVRRGWMIRVQNACVRLDRWNLASYWIGRTQ